MTASRVRRRDLRMIPVAVAAWSGALIATAVPGLAGPLAVALWAGAALALCAPARWRASAVAPLCAVALAAAAIVSSHVALAQPERERAASLPVSGGRSFTVDASVTGKVERSATGWRFDAVTHEITIGDTVHAVQVPIVVRASEHPDGLDLGATVRLRATAFPAGTGERSVLVVDASTIEVAATPAGPFAVAAHLRSGLLAQVETLPQPGAGLVAGLAVGDTAAVGDDLDAAMKTSSLSHLTAVSGANCALVVGIAYAAAAAVGLRRRWRIGLGLATLIGFVVLVSPEPSVVRAAAMAAIAMLAVLLGRPGAGVAVLSLAVSLCLALDPWLATTLGFALSAAATSALLLAAAPMAATMGRVMPHPLALALAVPLSAQLACTPLLIAIDPRMPLYAVVANVLATPAAPAATVLGLAACLTAAVPPLAAGLAALAWVPCAWIAATAEPLAAMPASSLPWWSGPLGVAAATVVSAAAVVWLVPAGRRERILAAAVVALVVGIGAGGALLEGPIGRLAVPQGWSVAVCDVGQGDAVLLRDGDSVALVDTGPDPAPLRDCLELYGVAKIDLLVLTHFDLDHRGGVDAVIDRTGVLLHGPPGGADDAAMLDAFAAAGTEVRAVSSGTTGRLGDARWRVLWPRSAGAGYPPGNDTSVVLDVRGGDIPSMLLLGDLSESPQRSVARELRGEYDIVKVAHHGSADQYDDLYRRASGALALVTVGENTYGHPRAEILDLVASLGATIVRTDTTGSAAVVERDGVLHVWRERIPNAPPDAFPPGGRPPLGVAPGG